MMETLANSYGVSSIDQELEELYETLQKYTTLYKELDTETPTKTENFLAAEIQKK
jgi:hypothetical protein